MVNRMTAQKYREKKEKSKRGCRVQIISYILKEEINHKILPFLRGEVEHKRNIRHRMCLCKRATGGQRVAERFLFAY